jgi:ribosomal protein L11 methyltransferase
MPPHISQTWIARFPLAATRAPAVADLLSERLDPETAVVSAFESAPGEWTVAAHFGSAPDEGAIRQLIRDAVGPEACEALTFEAVAAQDWVAASLQGLAPVEAGRFVVHGAHDRHRASPNRIAIEIEAGLAFGTGHHGTTRGCLLALDRILKQRRPRRVLDVGTGTGVLAIAAARALHRRVLASDIDVVAVRVARANARANRAGADVEFVRASGVAARRFRACAPHDLVFANILLKPLQQLAAPLALLVRSGGIVVLSGLLASQADAALSAYRLQGAHLVRRIELEGWTTLCLVKGGKRPRRAQIKTARTRPGR